MPVRIEKDNHGRDVLWSEKAGKPVPLVVDDVFIRLSDGHLFKAGTTPMARLEPHEPEMVEFYLRETDGPHAPNIFAGDTPPDGSTG